MTDDDPRDNELEEIRATYARYDRDGRSSIWDVRNPGFRRLSAERDAAILALIERHLGN
jgi:hypothetical protein